MAGFCLRRARRFDVGRARHGTWSGGSLAGVVNVLCCGERSPNGAVLDILVQKRPDKAAAKGLFMRVIRSDRVRNSWVCSNDHCPPFRRLRLSGRTQRRVADSVATLRTMQRCDFSCTAVGSVKERLQKSWH